MPNTTPTATTPLHLLQIWLFPHTLHLTLRYEHKRFADQPGATLIFSPEGGGGFQIHQDARLWRWQLSASCSETLALNAGRRYWLHCVKGALTANGYALAAGDALGIKSEDALRIAAREDCEFLLFDLR